MVESSAIRANFIGNVLRGRQGYGILKLEVNRKVTASGSTATATLVASYAYDAWGNVESVVKASADTQNIANLNPIRYRGYYQDTETGFYYLQSRYYDPVLYRFVNADSYASTGQGLLDHNMFTYCENNPVNYTDPSGHFAWIIVIAIVIVISVIASGCSTSNSPESQNCYGHASGIPDFVTPGVISGHTVPPDQQSNIYVWGDAVVADFTVVGIPIRPLNGPDDAINSDEYRIALRIGEMGSRTGSYDFHFLKQLENGCWSEKKGNYGEIEVWPSGVGPEDRLWRSDDGYYYTSLILYYAVGKH